jgi:hypothetical protein
MDVWVYDSPPRDPHETLVVDYLTKQTKNPEFSKKVGRMTGLYDYLASNRNMSPAEIRKRVLLDSKTPMFTKKQSEELHTLLAKSGGNQLDADADVLDGVIRRSMTFVYDWSPAFVTGVVDTVTPYALILNTLEQNEEFGPLLAIALDATEAGLKITASTIQTMSPIIIGLLPIPEAGPIGAVVGWFVASFFIFFLVLIHISRAHFGQAFIAMFNMIPIVGQSLYNAAIAGERFLTKTAHRREKLLEAVVNVPIAGPTIAGLIDSVVPDPLYVEPPATAGRRRTLRKKFKHKNT